MCARFLALVCLLCVNVSAATPVSSASGGTDVEVYLKSGKGNSSEVLAAMRHELTALMLRAGIRITFRTAPATAPAQRLVVVELRGACRVPSPQQIGGRLQAALPLASTTVSDGKVLPFSWVDCVALDRFLGPTLLQHNESVKNYMYGRAMARVLAHECYHVLTQAEDHELTGIAKARFSTDDLLAEHLDFNTVAVNKLQLDAPQPTAESASEDIVVSGR